MIPSLIRCFQPSYYVKNFFDSHLTRGNLFSNFRFNGKSPLEDDSKRAFLKI